MMKIRKEIMELLPEVKHNRRELHQIPEIGLATIKTKEYLIEQLSGYGVDEIKTGYAENGFAVWVQGQSRDAVGFRSDMDALPIQEETTVAFKSHHEGNMHACGHDGHMANMLALCHYICKHKKQLKQSVLFIFQPGEEGDGGARRMIDQGLFRDYPIQQVFGTHLVGDLPKGKIGCKAGSFMARNGEITIKLYGQSAHGAQPHTGNDMSIAMSSLLLQLQTIVSRNMDPLHNTVITFGEIHCGQVSNVIADHAIMRGTMRSFTDAMYEKMKIRMQQICDGIAESFQCKVELYIEDCYHVVDNDEALNELLKQVCGDDYLEIEPRMISEDFSDYQREVPGLFYFTGIQDERYNKNIHDCQFDFDEAALLTSVEVNVRLLEAMHIL